MEFLNELAESFSSIAFQVPSAGAWVALVAALLLLMCSAFVSGSEIAFFSLSPSDLNTIEESHRACDAKILSLRQDSERLLATILICNNLVNVAIIMLLNYFCIQTVTFGVEWLEFVCLTVVLTFLLLLFGEVVPKIYSSQRTLAFCRFAAPTLSVLTKLCSPLSRVLIRSRIVTERFVHAEPQSLTVDDLEKAMELTDKRDIAEESSMLQGIIRFGGEMAREVMTSRMDIVDLEIRTPFPEVLKCIVENNYSRIPVYQGSQDNIKGVLYFVPETKMIDDLLRDFQRDKVHIAIVVDEFGGTSGIVTMEDIIEEIVGEISDEYDEDERSYVRLNHNTFIFEGKTLLTDFTRTLKLDDEYFESVQGEADTLAGLLLEVKGDFPELHERTTFGRCTFEVMELDERRIVKVKVILKDEEPEK